MAPKKRKLADENGGGTAKKAKTTSAPKSMRITRNMTTDGPRQAVFNTAELLEAVLLELPMKQLFLIGRVSKQFRDCVNTSIKLQERMFLRPSKAEKESWTLRTLEPLQEGFLYYDQECEFVRSTDSITNKINDAENLQPASINPVISGTLDGHVAAARRWQFGPDEMIDLSDLKKWITHPGTWKNMYFTDPPCKNASISLFVRLNTEPSVTISFETALEVCDEAGLTFGGIAATLIEEAQELSIYRSGIGTEVRTGSISTMISEFQSTKKKGHVIKSTCSRLMPIGMVLATKEEWEEFRRKSVATASATA